MVGETGVGKSAVAGWLAGLPGWNRQAGESPGLRVTTVYWPAKLQNSLRIFKVVRQVSNSEIKTTFLKRFFFK